MGIGYKIDQIKSRQGFSLYITAAIMAFLIGVVYVYKYYNGTLEGLNTKTYCDKKSNELLKKLSDSVSQNQKEQKNGVIITSRL